MSHIIDLYKFTREIDRYTKENDQFPKTGDFIQLYAKKWHNGNRRYTTEISDTAQSSEYSLVRVEHGYYYLTLRGYNIVKGKPFFRPGLISLLINELNHPLALFMSLLALIVSFLVAVYK